MQRDGKPGKKIRNETKDAKKSLEFCSQGRTARTCKVMSAFLCPHCFYKYSEEFGSSSWEHIMVKNIFAYMKPSGNVCTRSLATFCVHIAKGAASLWLLPQTTPSLQTAQTENKSKTL